MTQTQDRLLLQTLKARASVKSPAQNKQTRPPIWMMRQAGRYLPEYREIRQKAGDFLTLCYTPAYATEVTLQPIRRYGFDGAIIFADILVLPHAMGQHLWFEKGEGPKLQALKKPADIKNLTADIHQTLAPIYQALRQTRTHLPDETTLLGFCGAPWTVACYMLYGQGSKNWAEVRHFAYSDLEGVCAMLDVLAEKSAEYLCHQIEAGADAVKVFDSWAGAVPPALQKALVIEPMLKIARSVKAKHLEVPVILFPRGVGHEALQALAHADGFDALAIDEQTDLAWAVEHIAPYKAIQGNLDNAVLLTTPEIVRHETLKMLNIAGHLPNYVVNLGHGVLPPTPLENVAAFVETVKNWEKPNA